MSGFDVDAAPRQLFGSLDPLWLTLYTRLHETGIVADRSLDPVKRELVWVAILAASMEQDTGTHVERARKAGASRAQVLAAIALGVSTAAHRCVDFTAEGWRPWLEAGDDELYRLVEPPAPALSAETRAFCLLSGHSVHQSRSGISRQLLALTAADPRQIVEAISYLIAHVGMNAVQVVCEEWLYLAARGEGPAADLLEPFSRTVDLRTE